LLNFLFFGWGGFFLHEGRVWQEVTVFAPFGWRGQIEGFGWLWVASEIKAGILTERKTKKGVLTIRR